MKMRWYTRFKNWIKKKYNHYHKVNIYFDRVIDIEDNLYQD